MPPWTCKSDLWEPSYKLFKRNQQKFNSGLYLDPAVEKCSQDPLKSIFRPLHLNKYFIPHILQAVYAKKSGEKNFSKKKWRGHCGLTHIQNAIYKIKHIRIMVSLMNDSENCLFLKYSYHEQSADLTSPDYDPVEH